MSSRPVKDEAGSLQSTQDENWCASLVPVNHTMTSSLPISDSSGHTDQSPCCMHEGPTRRPLSAGWPGLLKLAGTICACLPNDTVEFMETPWSEAGSLALLPRVGCLVTEFMCVCADGSKY